MTASARLLAVTALLFPLAAAPQGKVVKGKGQTEITWYGHAAFVIRTPGGTVLAVDPWFSNPKSPDPKAAETLAKVDYVLVTHGHADHVGDAIALAKRTKAKLVASFDLARALVNAGFPKDQAGMDTSGNVGGRIQAGDATVILVPAIHSSTYGGDQGPAQPAGSPVGFVIQVKGGPTIYHTGDTDVSIEMRLIPERYGNVDVMLACIGGHFTMDPEAAALAATFVRPRQIVPMHYGTFPALKGTPEALEAALKGRGQVVTLEPGKPAAF